MKFVERTNQSLYKGKNEYIEYIEVRARNSIISLESITDPRYYMFEGKSFITVLSFERRLVELKKKYVFKLSLISILKQPKTIAHTNKSHN